MATTNNIISKDLYLANLCMEFGTSHLVEKFEDGTIRERIIRCADEMNNGDRILVVNRIIANLRSLNTTDKSGNIMVARMREAYIEYLKTLKVEFGGTLNKRVSERGKPAHELTIDEIKALPTAEDARRVYNSLASYKSKTIVGVHAGLVDVGKMSKEDYDAEVADIDMRRAAAKARQNELSKADTPEAKEAEAAKADAIALIESKHGKKLTKADVAALIKAIQG